MNYKQAFNELQEFNRWRMGDSKWLQSYLDERAGRDTVVPSGVYHLTAAVEIPARTTILTINATVSTDEGCPYMFYKRPEE